jgi:hypothetical protein
MARGFVTARDGRGIWAILDISDLAAVDSVSAVMQVLPDNHESRETSPCSQRGYSYVVDDHSSV